MGLVMAVVLALIQGITEFLPISSSAHLILVPKLTGWPDQGLAFDVTLHIATSLAICIYLRGDLKSLVSGLYALVFNNKNTAGRVRGEGVLALKILIATIPVAVIGLLAHDFIAGSLRSTEVIAISSIFWGVVLWFADRSPGSGKLRSEKGAGGVGWRAALFVGFAQAISLIPGTSRSGITITGGLFTGLTRSAALRFAFLLSVPVSILAGGYETLKVFKYGVETPLIFLITGFVVAFLSAYLVVHLFLKLVESFSLKGFVVYRVLLGVLLLLLF